VAAHHTTDSLSGLRQCVCYLVFRRRSWFDGFDDSQSAYSDVNDYGEYNDESEWRIHINTSKGMGTSKLKGGR
jgi:hypothetical protein